MEINKEYYKEWRRNNPEKFKVILKRYRESEKGKKTQQEYYQKNKEKYRAYKKIWHQKNRKKILQKGREYYQQNKEKKSLYDIEYRRENREKRNGQMKKWREKNKEKMKIYFRLHARQLALNSPKYRVDRNISRHINKALRGKKAGRKWETLVGYTLQQLMEWLEDRFDTNMNWNNYGSYWSIDHKKPKALFHYVCSEDREFKQCWALDNLQPMEKIINIRKSNQYCE